MAQTYPDDEGEAQSFQTVEIEIGDSLYTAISTINDDGQPVEESSFNGTSVLPKKRTRGKAGLGGLSITWEDIKEATDAKVALGTDYKNKKFTVKYTLFAPGTEVTVIRYFGVRILSDARDHSNDEEALGEEWEMSYMSMSINGLDPILDF